MENKFTKGKWKSVYNGHYYDITTSLDNNRQSFAMTSKNSVLGVTDDTQKANALLISKAPEYHQDALSDLELFDELLRSLPLGLQHLTNAIKERKKEKLQLIKEATE